MALQLTYPGVYVQELPSGSYTIAGVATSIAAFVGYLRRGPPNVPVQCLNFGDFQRVFGGLDQSSTTSFQVSQFFINGGTEAWVSRLYAGSPAPVQPAAQLLALPTSPAQGGETGLKPPTGTVALNLLSQNPGAWGENIFVTVDYMTNQANTFNLTATLYAITSNSSSTASTYTVLQTMSLPAITLDQSKPNFINTVMSSTSNPYAQLLAVPEVPQSAAPVQVPNASGTLLQTSLPLVPPPTPAAKPTDVTFTVTVQAPGTSTASTATCAYAAPFNVVGDLVSALQSALASAVSQATPTNPVPPAIANMVVRSCVSPVAQAATGQASASAPPVYPNLIQVWSPDPTLAGYLVGLTSTATSLFSPLQVNYQAQQLTAPASTSPDGALPAGIDVAGNSTTRQGVWALESMPLVDLLLLPDLPLMSPQNYLSAATAALTYAVKRKAFAIFDLPATVQRPPDAVAWATQTPASFGTGIVSAATYFPNVNVPTPFQNQPMQIGPSGTLAGIYALTDQSRGVWKAPAGITAPLANVTSLTYTMTDSENGQINPLGINALRTFPIYGNVSWGARTLAAANIADEDWKYVSVRRLALYIEQSLQQGLQWVVFEPNDDRLWAQIRLSVNGFLHPLYLQGAFVGTKPSQAYQCVCDASTTTADDMENGIVNILILFAPVRPAEFVVISMQQMTGQASS